MTKTKANSLWVTSSDNETPWCTRCESNIDRCNFLGTPKQDSCCMLSLALDRDDLEILQKLGGPVILLND